MEISQTAAASFAAQNVAAGETVEASKISTDFETFLRMLTTQLENQDPLDPVKSEDFAVQLATFSGVEQQVLTNDLLRSLESQMALTGMAQYAGWVGMEARAPVAAYYDGSPITLAPQPALTSDQAFLVAKNESGSEVQRTQIPISHDTLEWSGLLSNGTAPDGLYSFTVESYSNGALTSSNPVEVYTPIIEARSRDGGAVLVTEGGVEVPASSVTALREPAILN